MTCGRSAIIGCFYCIGWPGVVGRWLEVGLNGGDNLVLDGAWGADDGDLGEVGEAEGLGAVASGAGLEEGLPDRGVEVVGEVVGIEMGVGLEAGEGDGDVGGLIEGVDDGDGCVRWVDQGDDDVAGMQLGLGEFLVVGGGNVGEVGEVESGGGEVAGADEENLVGFKAPLADVASVDGFEEVAEFVSGERGLGQDGIGCVSFHGLCVGDCSKNHAFDFSFGFGNDRLGFRS
jgi:hypothetical protein